MSGGTNPGAQPFHGADLFHLRGKVVLVTGAGQGVGAEIASLCAGHGCAGVVVNDFYADRAAATAERLSTQLGVDALPLSFDVSDFDATAAAVAEAEQTFGRVDILVNNAGNAGPVQSIADRELFWDSGPDDWRPWIDTSLFGVFNCSRAVVPGMIERGFGRIITVVSDAGRVGDPSLVVYAAAKAGAAGFTRSLARAVGRYGITANCVSLAAIRTTSTEPFTASDEAVKKLVQSYVIRRLGEPAEAAAMVLFLASDAASWITGQTIPVNGGFSFAM